MQSWQRGEPAGPLKNTLPALFVVDSHRRENQTLTGFEILGEVPGATKRTFLVKLTLSDPDAEEKARYSVIGIDPLWVYRHEDLEMLAHWEHPMPASSATSAEKQP